MGGGKDVSCSSVAGARKFFPYQLYGRKSFVGEDAAFQDRARRASLRCEQRGDLLIVPFKDFKEMCFMYGSIAMVWKHVSAHREKTRLSRLAKFHIGQPCHHLAASTLQKYVRERKSTSQSQSSQVVKSTGQHNSKDNSMQGDVL